MRTSSTNQRTDEPRIASPHQLADRTFLSGLMRLFDLTFLGVVVMAARFLGTEGFGLFIFGLTLATVVVSPLLEAFVPIMVKTAAKQPEHVGAQLGAVIPLQLTLMCGFFVLGWCAVNLLHWSIERHQIVLGMTLALGLRGPLEVLRGTIRGLGRFDLELQTIILERCLLLGGSAVVLVLGGGPISLVMCFTGTRLVSILFGLHLLERVGHRTEWQWHGWGRMLSEAMPYSLTKWVYSGYDQAGLLCLAWIWTDAAAGTYSAAWRLIDGASTIPQILVFVLLPELAARHGFVPTKVAPLVRRATAYTAMIALVLASVFLMEGPQLVGMIYGAGYVGTVKPFQILAIGILFSFTTEIARTTLWALERQRTALVVVGLGLILNIGLNLWFIPRYGAVGAAIATVLSGAIISLAIWRILARMGIQWPWLEAALKPGLIALAMLAAFWGLQAMSWPIRIVGASLTALTMVFVTKAITPMEWELLCSLPRQIIPRISRGRNV